MKKSWDNTNEDRNFSVEQLSACKEKIAVLQHYDTDDISELINDVLGVDDLVPCLKEFNKIFQDTIDEKGLAHAHGVFKVYIQEKRGRWLEHCRMYKLKNGREFLHSADTLNLLKHLHELHDESDPDHRGVRRLKPYFDWTYALPYYTFNIRLNGCGRY